MNNKLKISLLALAFIIGSSLVASAQIKPSSKKKDTEPTTTPSKTESETEGETTQPSTKTTTSSKKKTDKKTTDKYFDESGGFKHRLWYGANGRLSFYGLDYGSGNVFTIGLTPMIGYKIIGNWSAGPRFGLDYTRINGYTPSDARTKLNLYNYSAAAFSRYKIDFFPQIFAHVEYEFLSEQFPELRQNQTTGRWQMQVDAEGAPYKVTTTRQNAYVGAGYNAGGGLLSYEIVALYNLSITQQERDFGVSPLTIRMGFTYKF